MTVEQKAEEWIKDHSGLIGSYKFVKYDYDSMQKAFIDGYHECKKEHEWHKVLNGDLPKHDHEVLCLLWGGIREIGYYKNEVWYFEDFTADKEDVDYWQEIIPPKEIE